MSVAAHHDGREIRADVDLQADVVVIGSGPGGAPLAARLARAGARVVVLDAGLACVRPFADGLSAMAEFYRDAGMQVTLGLNPMPVVQGRALGGTSVVNGAIHWRLPEDVHARWLKDDPGLEVWDYAEIARHTDALEQRLGIHPTPPDIAGPNNTLLAKGAEALGLEHRPISRNVRDCQGLGRCLQGCPEGRKQSMDRTYLVDAVADGAELYAGVEVQRIEVSGGQAVGVTGVARGGGTVRIRAPRVVLSAGTVHSPSLLMASGIRGGPVGRGFMAHPGLSVIGRFDQPVRMWEGATQGHEVIGLRKQGLKFEALGYDVGLAAARAKGVGTELSAAMAELPYQAHWGAALKAQSQGRVLRLMGRPFVRYSLSKADLALAHRATVVLAELFFAAGAKAVYPGMNGAPPVLESPDLLRRLRSARVSATSFTFACTHLFGTCRASGDPSSGVVRPTLEHHHVEGLFVCDASVFPSNTGVNPQSSIIALSLLAAEGLATQG